MRAAATASEGNGALAVKQATEAARRYLLPGVFGPLPEWMKRVEVEYEVNVDSEPDVSIVTVQPLYQRDDKVDTVFTQLRFTNDHTASDVRPVTNFGIGYRRLLWDEKVLAGVNTFYDRDWEEGHQRIGVGAELKWNAFDLGFNYYEAFGGPQQVDNGIVERALDGYDIEFTSQVPYLPWARVRASGFEYFTKAANGNVTGYNTSMEIDLHQNLQVEFGVSDNNTADKMWFVRTRVLFGPGTKTGPKDAVALSRQPIDTVAFRMRDMRRHTLDKVRRNDHITVERTSAGVVISRAD